MSADYNFLKNSSRYIYTGKVQLLLTEEQIIDMLGMAHKFFLRDLENDIAAHLRVSETGKRIKLNL